MESRLKVLISAIKHVIKNERGIVVTWLICVTLLGLYGEGPQANSAMQIMTLFLGGYILFIGRQ